MSTIGDFLKDLPTRNSENFTRLHSDGASPGGSLYASRNRVRLVFIEQRRLIRDVFAARKEYELNPRHLTGNILTTIAKTMVLLLQRAVSFNKFMTDHMPKENQLQEALLGVQNLNQSSLQGSPR